MITYLKGATGKSIKKALPISQKSFEDIADTISQN